MTEKIKIGNIIDKIIIKSSKEPNCINGAKIRIWRMRNQIWTQTFISNFNKNISKYLTKAKVKITVIIKATFHLSA